MQEFKNKKGQITAFLSLIFVLLLSFVLAILESASIHTAKNQSRLDVDRAIFSVFGEYQKTLLKEYGIFAIDSSYGTGEYSENMILDRLAYYGSAGIQQEITDIQLLTDRQGQAFREQAVSFIKQKTGISLFQKVTGLADQWEEKSMQGEEISRDFDQLLEKNEGILSEEATSFLSAKKAGILLLALPKGFSLSSKSIHLGEQVSWRGRNTGRGNFPVWTGSAGTEGKIVFGQYLLDHFQCAGEEKTENRSLDYEIEYLLCGKSSDKENLKSVLTQILFFRMAVNYLYLMSDSQKQSQAETMAIAISILILQPETAELIKQILLAAWCFGESILDLRALLSGKKIVLAKSESTWKLKLSSLFQLGNKEAGTNEQEEQQGMDYKQYLRALLFLKDGGNITMRALDRVEQNLRVEKGKEFFQADNCITKIKLKNTAHIWKSYTYTFPTYYGYI